MKNKLSLRSWPFRPALFLFTGIVSGYRTVDGMCYKLEKKTRV